MLMSKKAINNLLDNLLVPEEFGGNEHKADSYTRNYYAGVASVDYGRFLHSLSERFWSPYSLQGFLDGVRDAELALKGESVVPNACLCSTEFVEGVNSVKTYKEWGYSLNKNEGRYFGKLTAQQICDYLAGVKDGVLCQNKVVVRKKN